MPWSFYLFIRLDWQGRGLLIPMVTCNGRVLRSTRWQIWFQGYQMYLSRNVSKLNLFRLSLPDAFVLTQLFLISRLFHVMFVMQHVLNEDIYEDKLILPLQSKSWMNEHTFWIWVNLLQELRIQWKVRRVLFVKSWMLNYKIHRLKNNILTQVQLISSFKWI